MAVLLFFGCALPVVAEPLPDTPPHRLDRNAGSGACEITLIPEETTGTAAPVLKVRSGGRAAVESLSIVAASDAPVVAIQLVAQNERRLFPSIPLSNATTVAAARLWRDLVSFARTNRAFYLTAELSDGAYASSRYEPFDPMGIVLLLEQNCGFQSDALTTKTDSQRREEELSLGLSAEQTRYIRWVLADKYSPTTGEPVAATQLTDQDRSMLLRYAKQIGHPPSRFLTRILATRLLAEPLVPRNPIVNANMRQMTRHGDWVSFVDAADGQCGVQTAAVEWEGTTFFSRPLVVMWADPNDSGNGLRFDLVSPNPFVPADPVWAVIDGDRIPLQHRKGKWIAPAAFKSGVSDDFVIGLRRSSDAFAISGTGRSAGAPLRIVFSPIGFSAAFSSMMRKCNRPGLADWLE